MDLLLRLLIAHLLTDFFLQPSLWVEDKRHNTWKSKYLYLHVLLTGAVAWLFLWDWSSWGIVLIVTATHLGIDLIKMLALKDNVFGFIVDQMLHLLVLVLIAIYAGNFHQDVTLFTAKLSSLQLLFLLFGFLLITMPAGYLIGKLTQKWKPEIETDSGERDSLKDAGIWIGILERVLILSFVIVGQYQAIGFLIAAKSILRYSDKNENNPRKQTEYVLIGTLLSFAIALFVGILVKEGLKYF